MRGNENTPVSVLTTLYDAEVDTAVEVTPNGEIITTGSTVLCGGGFGSSLDTYTYSTAIIGTGSVTVANAQANLSTGTTTGSTAKILSVRRARQQFGRLCSAKFLLPAAQVDAGCKLEFGIEIDATNGFGFRIDGSMLCVFIKRDGVETLVQRSAFNGNANGKLSSFNLSSVIEEFGIKYLQSRIVFTVSDEALHTFVPTTQSLGRQTGRPYVLVSNGTTTNNVSINLLGMAVFALGSVENIPKFYAYSGATGTETRILKATAGVLISIAITRASSSPSTVSIYDNTAGTGTLIALYDTAKLETIGDHFFGPNGLSFDNGLTYVVAGTPGDLCFTLLWE